MKILVVHNRYQYFGGEDVVFDQECNLLRKHGHEVSVYLRHNNEVEQYTGLRRMGLIPQTIWARDSRQQLEAILKRDKPEIVHVHNTLTMISPSIFSACEKAGVPVVHTLHNYRLMCPAGSFFREGGVCEECSTKSLWSGIRYGCYRNSSFTTAVVAGMLTVHRSLRTWTRPSHFYIALTHFARQKFVDAGLRSKSVFVKPNFVDPDPGCSNERDSYAVCVGRLSPEKCVDKMLRAWELGRARFPLLILGAGPEREKLEEIARQKKLGGVQFKGQVSRDEVIAAIRRARFLVFPSELYENFPVAIAEAFACGTPVICSRMGAMQEIVSDGQTGLHYTPGRVEELAQKMDWAWHSPDRMQEMAQNARREYEAKYTADTNYELLMNIYEQVLSRSGA